jgi:hypothetical protein
LTSPYQNVPHCTLAGIFGSRSEAAFWRATDTGVYFSVAAFTTYGGWGSEFRNKFVEPFYKSELKEAKSKGGDGWEVLNRKSRFVRHVAAIICRENSRVLSNAARMRPAGSRVVARGRSSTSSREGQ